jgi:putative transposase
VHGIISITDVGAGLKHPSTKPALAERYPISEIIRAFKTFSARQINKMRKTPGMPVWQRNYYEHVIRDEKELNQIREYINDNVLKWSLDVENPEKQKGRV